MNRIAVIDLGTGNLRSVARALDAASGGGCEIRITDAGDEVARADRVVFPGQGAIGSCMNRLHANPPLREALVDVLARRPFLGICIGLQALYSSSSEDGGVECLDFLKGEVRHFRETAGAALIEPETGRRLKVPHMGWNNVHQTRAHPVWDGIDQDAWFYFVHSYYPAAGEPRESCGTTEYGLEFTVAAAKGNVFAVQFHPEKSQRNGLLLLHNFINWDGASHPV